ncbi:MAG: tRNA (N(6)-L-threonylcarbamoyladenosine(37)-C(2))-methylthiotransferase MtaB, partial [Oligoflexia bacterium]|nr:tRNA (N(6)-L-threonylcarbamoyladenosine(37)-C(2))-methylthiotransferase MtaB [Oligoflexia bacterium]
MNSKINKGMKVSFYTLGCKLNTSETGSIIEKFIEKGYQVVAFEDCADIVYINTCTVTSKADSTCRNIIRRARKYSPNAIIAVTGCYAQLSSEKLQSMLEVDIVLGTEQKEKIFDFLQSKDKFNGVVDISRSTDDKFFLKGLSALEDGRTRAFLKVQ